MNKKIKVVMFDLDGTLLPMDHEIFIKTYFNLLSKKMAEYGYEPKTFIENIWKWTYKMMTNDGKITNEKVFWNCFEDFYGSDSRKDEATLEKFYENEFLAVKDVIGFNPKAKEVVMMLKERGYKVVLATNPVFPAVATNNRCRWAGLEPSDFDIVTTYENSSFCKPNPAYFVEIMQKLDVSPDECLMVGNDITEDGSAVKAGLDVFFLTECLLNKDNKDFSAYPNGNFNDLIAYLNE